MKPTEARQYLIAAVHTAVGSETLRRLGYGAVIAAPEKLNDKSTILLAEKLREELHRVYGF